MGVITLPVETKSREFYGKLWLASNLLELGHDVVFGYSSQVHSWDSLKTESKPDVHLEKSMTSKRGDLFKNLSEANAKIAVLDAEGGIYRSQNDYFNDRVSVDTLSYVDRIFAWGEDSAQAITNNSDFPNSNITVSGNPRFDLLSPKLRGIYLDAANKLNERYGNYILINTNFGLANHFKDNLSIDNNGKSEYVSQLLDKFIELIEEIDSSFPNKNIIIRPHPSEDHRFYEQQFSENTSIIVKYEGNVREWILSSDCVIHNSCTTGIESALLNVPVIAFSPISDTGSIHSAVPNNVSYRAKTIDDVVELIELNMGDEYRMNQEKKSYLKNYFHNIDTLAAPNIAQSLDEFISPNNFTNYPQPNLKEIFRIKIQKYPKVHQAIFGGRSNYSYQKFPGITEEEVMNGIQQFKKRLKINDITIHKLNKTHDVFLLTN